LTRVIIAGGGLSGCLAALALASRRPEVEILLIECGETFGGNHTWSFFDTDIEPGSAWVLDGIPTVRWPAHQVHFPRRSRTIPIGYNSIRSADLDSAVRAALAPREYRLGATIDAVGPHSVSVEGETIEADAVIDARGPSPVPGIELVWQKFVGRYYRFARPHDVTIPVIMDATVAQIDGFRFIYQLPVSPTDLLVEDTCYSTASQLDCETVRSRLDAIARQTGGGAPCAVEEEMGVLPIVLSGSASAFWAGDRIPRLGIAGGFFHPTTGYSLPDAVANAALLSRSADLETASIYGLLRDRAEHLWRERSFARLLNRMLFHAADPGDRFRVLEHFYRLPPDVIARFYAGRLSIVDKIRILSGKPPVPIGRAISALRSKAA